MRGDVWKREGMEKVEQKGGWGEGKREEERGKMKVLLKEGMGNIYSKKWRGQEEKRRAGKMTSLTNCTQV